MEQLPLDLALQPRFGREDFLVSPSNQAAVALLERWPVWPDRVLLLIGPEGAGKSHLAAIWAAQARARGLAAEKLGSIDPRDWTATPALLEDADQRVTGVEAGLFHLLNLVRDEHSFLLITARQAPDHWGLRTADLLSRLRLAPSVRIGAPDDDLMRAVLVKLFADRQVMVDTSVVAYLVHHLDRSLGAARRVVEALDRESLALNKRVTRAMAAKLLGTLEPGED